MLSINASPNAMAVLSSTMIDDPTGDEPSSWEDNERGIPMKAQAATLTITRGTPDGRYDEVFTVPYEPGASILDGLLWIRENQDPSLAFRFSCISANVCKECVMLINGKAGYACLERLTPDNTTLQPLANKSLLRDLACETLPPKETLANAKMFTRREN